MELELAPHVGISSQESENERRGFAFAIFFYFFGGFSTFLVGGGSGGYIPKLNMVPIGDEDSPGY